MTQKKRQALTRAFELRRQDPHIGWKAIADVLEHEGYVSDSDKPYAASTLRAEFSRYRGQIERERDERSYHADLSKEASHRDEHADRSEASERCEPADNDARSHHADLSSTDEPSQQYEPDDSLRAAMTEIAREVFREMMHDVNGQPESARVELPPEPERIEGKKTSRRYARLTVTVDENLARLLDKHAARTRLSRGRIVDAALWSYFGKPRLSYYAERSHQGDPE